ncbi:hypothetical protein BIV57_13900 [Mangrovactinospora gilvigrisea]|uniref:Uncharacterized protein n=1 Tax=Mangrovactinospora gilvigrisea TaxID=1428644 RepID=A0A1J7BDV2_9ACTN|nr:hypothetical protein [Mangrovactinospora gilvigrisea]OIV36855.1 hypothetical protein BIV57_13900 [Mangrovactinospora gilvigrisea]
MVKNHAGFLVERGVPVEVLTVNQQVWRDLGLHPSVTVHTLREGEGRHPLPRGERVLVYRAPGKAIDLLRPLGRHPRHGRTAEIAVGVLERAHRRAADAFHLGVFVRGYRVVRPYLLWRVAHTRLAPALDPARFERVVACDSHAVPIAWHLARQSPRLVATLEFDRSVWDHLPVVAQAQDGEEVAAP